MTAREPRGFGFIQYFGPEDASDAKYHMDGKMLLGREIVVVFAEENRKKPADMRAREKNKCPNPIDWLTYHLDRSLAPRPRERSLSRSPAVNTSRSASPIVSRSPRRQGSLSVSE
ncbi:Serine/arginine-rich SC35-like splicing factor SCL30A [Zea mays]|uniref:Serine/arginine-rich SC35-like splicing factor SCL30A n=1 Tax=Zea mays TaxID=4577 RepID=A0A3L6G482_MAIZE|nr:Serine/arginine-rich SC35-like splicing factor SCL30A [Zea mays]